MRWNKNRLITFPIILILFLSFIAPAFAQIPCICGNTPDECTCFIQYGDKGKAVEGIIAKLKKLGYLRKNHKKSEFTLDVRKAVISFQADHNLDTTGYMDDETLDTLLFDILPDPSAKYEAERWFDVCYVPTDGGVKYHTNPECSGMLHPRMISRVNAEKLGIYHCLKKNSCPYASDSHIQYSSIYIESRILPDEYYIDETTQSVALASVSSVDFTKNNNHSDATYIGNKNSHIFHRSTCSSVNRMSEKNKVIFNTREEAISKGFDPCCKCNP